HGPGSSGVAEWQLPLPTPAWKLSGNDMDPTERIQLLVGLPHGSRSYAEPFAHGLDVICDRRIPACSLLLCKAFCLCIEQVDGNRAHDECRVRGVEDTHEDVEQPPRLQAGLETRRLLDILMGVLYTPDTARSSGYTSEPHSQPNL